MCSLFFVKPFLVKSSFFDRNAQIVLLVERNMSNMFLQFDGNACIISDKKIEEVIVLYIAV
jgi:hypothetical protein